jgi:hypothetical protein
VLFINSERATEVAEADGNAEALIRILDGEPAPKYNRINILRERILQNLKPRPFSESREMGPRWTSSTTGS